jgi:hypothetical protein
MTREGGLAAVAAMDRAPELLWLLVDRVSMAIEVSGPCKSFCAPWPIARNPLVWSASAGGHVMNDPYEKGRGAVAYLGCVGQVILLYPIEEAYLL